MDDEPDHQELCNREQAFFLKAIREDLDLTDWMNDAVNSLHIVLAADESIRTKRASSSAPAAGQRETWARAERKFRRPRRRSSGRRAETGHAGAWTGRVGANRLA